MEIPNGFDRLYSRIINLRNNKVQHGVQTEYGGHPLAPTLQTFCVSNTLYWDHRMDRADVALPYLQLSGIINLRQHCIGIVAEDNICATKTYVNNEVPAFLGSLQLWVNAGAGNVSAERRQGLLDKVSMVQRELDEVRC